MQYEQSQDKSTTQFGQANEQKDRVKQGEINIDHDVEHHEASTMNTLSVENLSSSNLDHDAAEALHKGWEKATDTIAQGVELVKRIVMQELPPVEGENLKEKAENLKEQASEKIQEVKETVKEQVASADSKAVEKTNEVKENVKEQVESADSKAVEKTSEVKENVEEQVESADSKAAEKTSEFKEQIKPQGQEQQRGARTSEQADFYRSNSGSTPVWEPTQQMKDLAHEKLGQFKEKFNRQGDDSSSREQGESENTFQPQQSSSEFQQSRPEFQQSGSEVQQSRPEFQQSKPESHQESAVLIEQGKEKELGTSANSKIQEIEGLSHQLNQKVEELKRSAAIPTNNASETIIIIQEGGLGSAAPQMSQTQFTGSQPSFSGSQSQESQRPKLGHQGEQEWRNQEGGQDFSSKISEKAQELKEGFKHGFDKGFEEAGSNMPSEQTQEQRPKLGHQGEQKWRSQESEQGEQGFAGKLGDKIKEKVSDKANDLKESYQSNLQEVEKKAEQRWSEQPKEHHESEHHLTTESESFKPTAESRSILEHELLQKDQQESQPEGQQGGEQTNIREKLGQAAEQVKEKILPSSEGNHQGSEHHLSASSESFQPTGEGESLIQKELLGKQGEQESQTSDLKGKLGEATEQIKQKVLPSDQQIQDSKSNLESQASNLKGKLGEAAEQIKEKVLPSNEESQGKSLKDQISEKVEEVTDKIMPLDEAEKQFEQSQQEEQSRSTAPPAEIKESITYHPQEIRGYEIEYVPKHESEGQESQSKSEESQPKEESQPAQERIPFLDRVQHGFESASSTYKNIKSLFKPGKQGEETSEETGYQEENLRTGAPPAEIKENITYHPRDIKGYEIEYVPKHHSESSQSQPQSQSSQTQAPVEIKEAITYHPRDIKGYEIEYVPKSHEEGQTSQSQSQEAPKQQKEGEQSGSQESEQKPVDERVPLVDKVQHGLESIKGFFHHSQGEQKESVLSKAPENVSELSKILESQAEVLKTKYSALKDDQPHGEELIKGETSQKSEESHETEESQGGKGLFGRVSGAIHSITDKFTHGASQVEGKIAEGKDKIFEKEEPKKAESPREKIYEFNPKAKKAEEKSAESEEKPSAGFVSRIGDKLSHGIEGVKGKIHPKKEESYEETSTEKNQSVFEKIQGKFQGKQTGEEVDKQGFRKVHDGFSETVDELKHEQNEQYIEQVHVANENPFEPLRTKQAAMIDHPVTSTELVGGNLKQMTANFDETEQEMIPDDEEKKRGLLQKMKDGLFSKFGHGNKETEESS